MDDFIEWVKNTFGTILFLIFVIIISIATLPAVLGFALSGRASLGIAITSYVLTVPISIGLLMLGLKTLPIFFLVVSLIMIPVYSYDAYNISNGEEGTSFGELMYNITILTTPTETEWIRIPDRDFEIIDHYKSADDL